MGKKIEKSNWRVRVEPKRLGDLGMVILPDSAVAGNISREYEQRCEEIVADVRRHVNNVGWVGAVCDIEAVCEFCSSKWTEGDSPHNGGCCAKDAAIMEATEEVKA